MHVVGRLIVVASCNSQVHSSRIVAQERIVVVVVVAIKSFRALQSDTKLISNSFFEIGAAAAAAATSCSCNLRDPLRCADIIRRRKIIKQASLVDRRKSGAMSGGLAGAFSADKDPEETGKKPRAHVSRFGLEEAQNDLLLMAQFWLAAAKRFYLLVVVCILFV